MKAFLRKKSTSDAPPTVDSPPRLPPLSSLGGSTPSSPPTPLYARFASTSPYAVSSSSPDSANVNGATGGGAMNGTTNGTTGTRPVVSGPMTLGSANRIKTRQRPSQESVSVSLSQGQKVYSSSAGSRTDLTHANANGTGGSAQSAPVSLGRSSKEGRKLRRASETQTRAEGNGELLTNGPYGSQTSFVASPPPPHDKPLVPAPVPVSISINEADEAGEEAGERPVLSLVGSARVVSEYGHGHGAPLPRHTDLHQHTDPQHKEHKEHKDQQKEPRPEARDPSSALPSPPLSPVLQSPSKPKEKTKTTSSSGIKRYSRQGQVVGVSISNGGGEGVGDGQVASPNGITTTTTTTSRMGPEATGRPQGAAAPYMRSEDATSTLGDGDEYEYVPGAPAGGYASAGSANGHVFTANGYSSAGSETHRSVDGRSEKERERGRGSDAKRRTASASASSNGSYETMEKVAGVGTGSAIVRVKALPALEESAVVSSVSPSPASPSTSTSTPPPPPTQIPKPTHHTHRTHGRTASDGSANVIVDTHTQSHTHSHSHSRSTSASQIPVPTPSQIPTPTSPVQVPGPRLRRMSGSTSISVSSDKDRDKQGQGPITPPHSVDDHTSILSSHSSSHARHRTASLSRSKRDTSHTQRQDEDAPRTSVGMRKGPLIFQSKEERFGSASAAMGTANGPWPPPVPVQAPIPPTTASQPVDIPVFIRPSEDKGFIPPRRRSMQILAPSTSPSPSISTSLPVLSSSSPSSSPVSLIQGAQVPLMTREEREMEKERSKSRERGHRRHGTGTGTGTVITTGAPIPPSTQTSPVTPRQTYGDLSNADEPALPRADVQSVKSVKSVTTTSDHHHHHQGRFLANNDIHHPLPVSPQLAHLREAKTSQTSLSMNESDESSAYPRTSMSQHSQSHSGSKPNSRAGREREREGEVEVESEVDGHGGASGIEVANGTRSVPGSGAEAEAEDGVLSAEASVKDRKKKKKAEEKEEKERQKDRSVTPHSRHLAVPPLLAPSTSEKAHNRLRKAHKHSSMPPLAPSPASSTNHNHRESMVITHSSPTHSPNPNTNTNPNSTFSDSGTVSTQAGSQTSRKTSSRRLLTKQRPAGNGKHGHGHGDPQQQHERPTHSREEGSLVIVDSDIPNGNGNDNNTQQSQSHQTHKAGILSIDEDPFAKSGLQVLPVPSKAPSQKSSTLTTDAISSSSSDAMGNKGREISPSGMVMEMEHGRTPRRAREGQNQHQHQNRRQWRLGVSDEGGLGDEDDGGGGHGYVGERDGSEDHSHYSASIGSGGGGGISINGATSISNGHGYSSSAPSVVEKRSYRNGHGHGHGLGRSGSVSGSVSGSEDQHRGRMMMRPSGVEEVLSSEVETVPEDDEDWSWYPLVKHLSEPALLAALLNELSFPEWMALWSLTKEVRTMFEEVRELREVALERYLGIVGYVRWRWEPHTPEPLRLTLKELAMYMRGVSTPPFEYAQTAAAAFLPEKTPEQIEEERGLKKGARAYTRLVIRLREQAETEADQVAMMKRAPSSLNGHSPVGTPGVGVVGSRRASAAGGPPPAWGSVPPRRAFSRQSTRAPSPSFSIYAHGHNNAPREDPAPFLIGATFRSPLFRLRRAPLLRVFVPSAEGEWLSDEAILECETELKKAGVVALLRPGDIVWDTALGDEGNVGRLAWDGRYLIDLDFTYSETGDLPAYLPSLAFPPPYFHRVIRTAGEHNNPVCHIDVSPWGNEIMSHLQLLQDRVKTETPQGSVHMVVHWVHRSSFRIRTPPPYQTQSQRSLPGAPLLVLPTKERRPVDMGWVGTVVVETEGTNEGLADLKGRCRGGYPSRKGSKRVNGDAENGTSADVPNVGERERCVWRILRERSRPGEIWLKAVTFKERLLP